MHLLTTQHSLASPPKRTTRSHNICLRLAVNWMCSKSGLSEQVYIGDLKSPGGNLPPCCEIDLPATFRPEGLEGVTASRRNIHNYGPRFPLVVVFAGEARMVSGQREELRDRGMTTKPVTHTGEAPTPGSKVMGSKSCNRAIAGQSPGAGSSIATRKREAAVAWE